MNRNTLFLIIFFNIFFVLHASNAKQRITNPERGDGFGAQFQTTIFSVIFAELNGFDFVYTPFKNMEHNYDNDPQFIAKKEWLINFIDNFELNNGDAPRQDMGKMIQFFESHLTECAQSQSLKKIKEIFRKNKNVRNYFDKDHLNIVIHIRRPNSHDSRIDGTNTPDELFLNIIDQLRILYSDKNPLFHLHSQGDKENFKNYSAPDIVLHLNESTEDSFTEMVLADVLVTSRSSFSYTAGILSQGTVYYMPFWHPPLPGWISLGNT